MHLRYGHIKKSSLIHNITNIYVTFGASITLNCMRLFHHFMADVMKGFKKFLSKENTVRSLCLTFNFKMQMTN